MANKLLYLVRHGEHDDPGTEIDDGLLTEVGMRQSKLLGERLRHVPFTAIHHSPLRRAVQSTELIAGYVPSLPVYPSELLRDCIPMVPDMEDLSPAHQAFFDGISEDDRIAGRAQAAAALDRFAVATDDGGDDDQHELLVTHNFVIGWFVRHALDAPDWRWIGLNQFNCGLTIILYRPDRPAALVSYNDIGHLPPALRGSSPPLALYS